MESCINTCLSLIQFTPWGIFIIVLKNNIENPSENDLMLNLSSMFKPVCSNGRCTAQVLGGKGSVPSCDINSWHSSDFCFLCSTVKWKLLCCWGHNMVIVLFWYDQFSCQNIIYNEENDESWSLTEFADSPDSSIKWWSRQLQKIILCHYGGRNYTEILFFSVARHLYAQDLLWRCNYSPGVSYLTITLSS